MKPATVTIISSDEVRAAFLAEIELPEGTRRVWTGWNVFRDNTGRDWQPIGSFGVVSDVSQEGATVSSGFTAQLAAPWDDANPENASRFARELRDAFRSDISGGRFTLYIQAFNQNHGAVNSPQRIGGGIMGPARVSEDNGVSRLEVDVSGVLADGSSPAHGFVTDEDQQARFAGDKFFEFTPLLHTRTFRWPRS